MTWGELKGALQHVNDDAEMRLCIGLDDPIAGDYEIDQYRIAVDYSHDGEVVNTTVTFG